MTSEGMSKKPQVLQIDPPHEISFKGPFKDVVTSYLKLTNPSDDSVCFKVKTTAPKRYCVRPNSGIIPPKQNVQVAVMLQPTDDGSTLDERSKHKFMVQTCVAPDANTPLEAIWKSVASGDLMDSKLRVSFQHDSAGDSAERSQTDAFSDSPAKPSINKAPGDEVYLLRQLRKLSAIVDPSACAATINVSSDSSDDESEPEILFESRPEYRPKTKPADQKSGDDSRKPAGSADAELQKKTQSLKRLQEDYRNLESELEKTKDSLSRALSSRSAGGGAGAAAGGREGELALAQWQLIALAVAMLAIGIALGNILF